MQCLVDSCVVLFPSAGEQARGVQRAAAGVDRDSSTTAPLLLHRGRGAGAFEDQPAGALLTAAAINRKVKDHYLLHVKVFSLSFVFLF